MQLVLQTPSLQHWLSGPQHWVPPQQTWLAPQHAVPELQHGPEQVVPHGIVLPQAFGGELPHVREPQVGAAQQSTVDELQPQVHASSVMKAVPCALHWSWSSAWQTSWSFKQRPQ